MFLFPTTHKMQKPSISSGLYQSYYHPTASTISTYSSSTVLQGLNHQCQLLKASVCHSATLAGNGNSDKGGGQAATTAAKRAVAMARTVVGKDEGNGKGGKSNGNGNKEGNCKEEGHVKQQ
jgi:hypothetical protein